MKLNLVLFASVVVLAHHAHGQCIEQFEFPPGSESGQFGSVVGLDGDTLFVREPGSDAVAMNGGVAHVYERQGATWVPVQVLAPAGLANFDAFPNDLDVSGDLAVLGHSSWDERTGRVLVYSRTPNGWAQTAVLPNNHPDPLIEDDFGRRVSLDGDRVAVATGFPRTVAIFERDSTGWSEVELLTAPADSDNFGGEIVLAGGRLAIRDRLVTGRFIVRIYEPAPTGSWLETARLNVDAPETLGRAIDFDGDRLFFAAEDVLYVYRFDARQGWTPEPIATPFGSNWSLGQPGAVAVDGDWIAAGDNLPGARILIWHRENGTWRFHDWVRRSGNGWGGFGVSLDLSGGTLAVGAPASFNLGMPADRVGRVAFLSLFPRLIVCSSSVNSTGQGARLDTEGTTLFESVPTPDVPAELRGFRLVARDAPAGVSGLFYFGPTTIQVPFGDGFRCVGGATTRLPLVTTSAAGTALTELDVEAAPITPSSTWTFQFWFRDPVGPGGSGFNLTDAREVTFCP